MQQEPQQVEIEAQTMRKLRRKRKKRSIKARHPETKRIVPFAIATMTGNCCWRIYDSYRGGIPFDMGTSQTYDPGWFIRSLELMTNCNFT